MRCAGGYEVVAEVMAEVVAVVVVSVGDPEDTQKQFKLFVCTRVVGAHNRKHILMNYTKTPPGYSCCGTADFPLIFLTNIIIACAYV